MTSSLEELKTARTGCGCGPASPAEEPQAVAAGASCCG